MACSQQGRRKAFKASLLQIAHRSLKGISSCERELIRVSQSVVGEEGDVEKSINVPRDVHQARRLISRRHGEEEGGKKGGGGEDDSQTGADEGRRGADGMALDRH